MTGESIMKIAVIILTLILSGCASGLAGKQAKNGGPERVERLGMMTSSARSEMCSDKQVRWCARRGRVANCQCILVQDAKQRVRQLAEQMRRQAVYR